MTLPNKVPFFVLAVLAATALAQSSRGHQAERRTRQRSITTASTPASYVSRTYRTFPPTPSPPPPLRHGGNTEIEYRLMRLETLLVEKLDNLRTEIRDTSRRLQALEQRSSEAHFNMENLKQDLNRVIRQVTPSDSPDDPGNADPDNTPSDAAASDTANSDDDFREIISYRIQNLATGLNILVTATRQLTNDINLLRNNVTSLVTSTQTLSDSTSDLVTKQYLNTALGNMQRHQPNHNTIQPQPIVPGAVEGAKVPPPRSSPLPRSCHDAQMSGVTQSGLNLIQPSPLVRPFTVYCDLETRGGGWTVIQNRYDGSQDFFQSWHTYRQGFGNLEGEFWLGLEKLHLLTGDEINELLVELQDWEGQNRSALYASFSVASEAEGYALRVLGAYSGDAGDSLVYHAGNKFTTMDRDQDAWPEGNCAQEHYGGWWYKSCDKCNLNGKYLRESVSEEQLYQGMYWQDFHGAEYSLMKSRIMIRPKDDLRYLMDIFTQNPNGSRK